MSASREAHYTNLIGVDVKTSGIEAKIADSLLSIVESIRILMSTEKQTIVSNESRNALYAVFKHEGRDSLRLKPSRNREALIVPIEP